MHATPAKPNPKPAAQDDRRKKRDESELTLIVVLTFVPLTLLAVLWLFTRLEAAGWTAVFSGLLILCTSAQALYAKWQRDTMAEQMNVEQQQLTLASETAQRQLRAYCLIVKCTPIDSGLDEFAITFDLKNCGQTPAYKVAIDTDIDFRDFPFIGIYPARSTSTGGKAIIGPGEHAKHTMSISVPRAEYEKIRGGKRAVYVDGRVEYVDAFGFDRWTEFRFYSGGDVQLGVLAVAEEGNDAN